MKLFLLILCTLVFCSSCFVSLIKLGEWAESQIVQTNYGYIITDEEAEIVHNYHGILSMKWSIPHKDFVFERDGETCKARAFEVLKENK